MSNSVVTDVASQHPNHHPGQGAAHLPPAGQQRDGHSATNETKETPALKSSRDHPSEQNVPLKHYAAKLVSIRISLNPLVRANADYHPSQTRFVVQ
ncbi:MAG: hypothetical protein RLZZ396_965 [Planctomycetota bacterium]